MDAEIVTKKLADCRPCDSPEVAPRKGRSRISNGSSVLRNIDGRSPWVRIRRDTLQDLKTHCGGNLSATQLLAVRKISTLEAELTYLENEFAQARAEGREPDLFRLELFGRLSDRQRRLSEPLGWLPTPRDVTKSLDAIMNEPADVE